MTDEFEVVHHWRIKLGQRQGIGYNLAQAFGIADAHFGAVQEGEWELVLRRKGRAKDMVLVNAGDAEVLEKA